MPSASLLPHITASLNATALALLVSGLVLIRRGRKQAHRRAMLAAVAVSAVFLGFYLLYHFTAPVFVFPGSGPIRAVYYALLISHVVLSVVALPLIALTLHRAVGGRFAAHRLLARPTLAVWMYVSASGVAVYLLLYHR